MQDKLKKTARRFTIISVSLATLSVLLLGAALYEANIVRFNDDIVSDDLYAAVEDFPEVKEYVESEHAYEAHFITIANIIRTDQQKDLGEIILYVTVPVLLVASLIGYFASRRLMKPVEEAYESQERFIADAAHELRNPLATMSALIQNADRNPPKNAAERNKIMLQMRRQLGRMVRINEDLLYLERNMMTDEVKQTNVSELLQDVLEDLQPHAQDRKIAFKLDIDETVMLDISQRDFVRLTKNVVENAIKYSKPSSKNVHISLKGTKKGAQFTVKDSGIGIPEEDLQHISERFYRARNAESLPGSGLGMAIVFKIASHYNGSVDIESKLGRGTTVTVNLA